MFQSFGHSMRTVRGYAWRVFGTDVLVFLILIAFAIVLGFILILLPLWLRSFVNSVVSGTLIAPFLALVATLVYYRLTAPTLASRTPPPAQRARQSGSPRPVRRLPARPVPRRAAAVPGPRRATTTEHCLIAMAKSAHVRPCLAVDGCVS